MEPDSGLPPEPAVSLFSDKALAGASAAVLGRIRYQQRVGWVLDEDCTPYTLAVTALSAPAVCHEVEGLREHIRLGAQQLQVERDGSARLASALEATERERVRVVADASRLFREQERLLSAAERQNEVLGALLQEVEAWVPCSNVGASTNPGGVGGMALTACGVCDGCQYIARIRAALARKE